ncbi:MAG TPA: peptidase M16 [Rhodobacteraceae bacterium]|jgi:zinc protease|nr:peptidase M16 [Paracoccaceae bacterium]
MKHVYLALIAILFIGTAAKAEVKIQHVTSPGGITAWLVEEHSIPFTALEIRFKGGASLDAKGKRGATSLMTYTLEEGAGDLNAREFAAKAEALAAHFSFDISDDTLSVSAKFLSENQADAMDLLRLALQEPRFDPADIDRIRAQVISGLQDDAKNPNSISSSNFKKLAFGDHPYASSRNGTIESVKSLSRDDLIAAKAAVMARDRLFVGAVGDITPQELGKLLDDLLGGLPATGAKKPEQAEFLLKGGVTVIPFDTPQSVVTFGAPGINQDDDDFFAAYLMNTILGGSGRQSRLMEEVREKRGLTYGIYTYFASRDFVDVFMGRVASANNRIAKTIEVIRDVWLDLAKNGVTPEELEGAKTYLTGAYPLRFDGNATIANILVGMQLDGLPIDYIATRNDRLNAVTMQDIDRVIKRLIRPEDLHFVVVGQPEGIKSTD